VRLAIEDYEPQGKLTLELHACGAPSWDGSVMRLQPTTAGSVADAWRVDAPTVVPAVLLDRQALDDDGLTNYRKVLILGSQLPAPFACVSGEVIRRVDTYHRTLVFATEVTGCLVMTQKGSESVTFASASGGDAVRLLKDRRSRLAEVSLNDANLLSVRSVESRIVSQLLGDC
jgi:hypothetical protein